MTSNDPSDDSFILVDDYEHLAAIFHVVADSITSNVDYYIARNDKQAKKFIDSFQSILDTLKPLEISLNVIVEQCARFDVSQSCKGNGYRSIISIVESCLNKIVYKSEQIQKSRDKIFFHSSQVYAKVNSYAQVLSRLLTIVQFAVIILDNSDVGCLFPRDTPDVKELIDGLLDDFNNIDRECFYGRCFGFQYVYSLQQALRVIGIAMAAYGDGYSKHTDNLSRAVSSFMNSGKYFIDPELRAKRITELTQGVNIEFCKAFWSLTDEYGVQHAPLFVCPAMSVNLEFTIPPDDVTIEGFDRLDGSSVRIKFPVCNGKRAGVKARLLSYEKYDGQTLNILMANGERFDPTQTRHLSPFLMIHCHGGGFVAQSSKSHEIYLRQWAKELKFPLLSIDYSLSPDVAFPQALNEVFFAYVWAMNNCEKLGSTGEKIIFTGDSAGANLVTAVALKAIHTNVRVPDCLVVAYPPYRAQYYPSPSRILCLMDPLLPLGVLQACLQAYAGDLKAAHAPISPSYDACSLALDDVEVPSRFPCQLSHHLSEGDLTTSGELAPAKHKSSNDEVYYSDSEDIMSYSSGEARRLSKSIVQASNKRDIDCGDKGLIDCGDKGLIESKVLEEGLEFSICKGCLRSEVNCNCKSKTVDSTALHTDDYQLKHVYVNYLAPQSAPCSNTGLESPIEAPAEITDNCENIPRDFRNPLMSPIFASDELLNKMPPMAIFACSLDPLFDDSVEFIRRLQNLNKDAELHVLDRLPHGFLNFQVFSPEAREACGLMISAMKNKLGMDV